MTSRIPYKGPYVVKSQLVEQNDPFLINEIACTKTQVNSPKKLNKIAKKLNKSSQKLKLPEDSTTY